MLTPTLVNKHTLPPTPTFTVTALGTVPPAVVFKLDEFGGACPHGYTVTNPAPVAPTAVTFNTTADTSPGTPGRPATCNCNTEPGPDIPPPTNNPSTVEPPTRESNNRAGATATKPLPPPAGRLTVYTSPANAPFAAPASRLPAASRMVPSSRTFNRKVPELLPELTVTVKTWLAPAGLIEAILAPVTPASVKLKSFASTPRTTSLNATVHWVVAAVTGSTPAREAALTTGGVDSGMNS